MLCMDAQAEVFLPIAEKVNVDFIDSVPVEFEALASPRRSSRA